MMNKENKKKNAAIKNILFKRNSVSKEEKNYKALCFEFFSNRDWVNL